MDELIICFKRELLSTYLDQSIVFYNPLLWYRILDNLQVIPRSKVEEDIEFKQLVVYIVIKSGDFYLTYQRSAKTGEQRLSEKYSLGIGGHVDIADKEQLSIYGNQSKDKIIYNAIWRELMEEVDLKLSNILAEPKIICFINDDSDAVGKVHFGVVSLLKIKKRIISRREGISKGKGIAKLNFYDLDHLNAKKSHFEKWSQLLIDYFMENRGDI